MALEEGEFSGRFFGQPMSKKVSTKRGRKPIGKRALTDTEKKRRYRRKKAEDAGKRPRRRKTEAQYKRDQRREKTARYKREMARKARDEADRLLAEQTGGSYVVHHVGIDDITPEMLADASVDAIITDPPYPEEFLPTFSSLASLAERTLKPGGWCVVMTGNIFLPEVMSRLSERLAYRWQYMVPTPGGGNVRISSIGLFQGYKPVLLYQKPPVSKIREWWSDVIKTEAAEQDKSRHPWQQSEPLFAELVRRFSRPGELVVDPFAGSGTTGRATITIGNGRHFWGCDIDPECATSKLLEAS